MREDSTQHKKELLAILSRHIGKENAISMPALYESIYREDWGDRINDTRKLRHILTDLRKDGIPICSIPYSDSGGYYLPSAASELDDYCSRIRSRGLRALAMEAKIRRTSLPELLGQIRLSLQTDSKPQRPVGIEGITLALQNVTVGINQGGGTKDGADNTTVVDLATTHLDVRTGVNETDVITLDFPGSRGTLLEAAGSAIIGVQDFFYLSGSVAFGKMSGQVALHDTATNTPVPGTVDVDMLTIGATGVTAFVGVNGPFWTDLDGDGQITRSDVNEDGVVDAFDDLNGDGVIDANESDELNEASLGLSLSGVEFAIAMVSVKAPEPTVPPTLPTDLRSWMAVKARVGDAMIVGIEGLTLAVQSLNVEINQCGGGIKNDPADADFAILNTTVVNFDIETGGIPFEVKTGPGETDKILMDFKGSDGKLLQASGQVNIGLFGFFHVSGGFAFVKKTETVRLYDTATGQLDTQDTTVDLLTVGASGVDAFVGVNGPYFSDLNGDGVVTRTDVNEDGTVDALDDLDGDWVIDANESDELNEASMGLSLTNVNFALALMKVPLPVSADPNIPSPEPTDLRTWMALKAHVGSAEFVGIDGLTVSVQSFNVEINQSGGGIKNNPTDADFSTPNTWVVDFGTTPLEVKTGSGEEDKILLDFAGTDGHLLQAAGNVTIDLFGFFYVSGDFAFVKKSETVLLSNTHTVSVDLLTIGAQGVDAFVGINGPYWSDLDGDGEISWTDEEGNPLPGDPDLDHDGEVDANETAELNEESLGLSLIDVNFALALMKIPTPPPADPTIEPTDLRSWTAMKANVGRVEFVGIDGLTIAGEDLMVSINQAGGTNNGQPNTDVVNFAGDTLDVKTGPDAEDVITLDFDGSDGALLEALGNVTIAAFGFFYVSGNFGFQKKSERVRLHNIDTQETDTQDTSVDLLTFGANGVTAFAGVNGPYWMDINGNGVVDGVDLNNNGVIDADESDELNKAAVGLSLENVGVALAMMKPRAPPAQDDTDLRTWTAIDACVGGARFVGVEGLTLAMQDLDVEINQSGGGIKASPTDTTFITPNNTVVDFQASFETDGGLVVSTGPDSSNLIDFTKKILRAQGNIAIGIFDFLFLSGNFAFEKSSDKVTLSDGSSQPVNLLTLGADNVNAFAGINGPYLLDDNGTPDDFTDDTVNDAALGLSLYNVNFALALMSVPQPLLAPGTPPPAATGAGVDLRTWTALQASVGSAEFVGIDGLTVQVQNFAVAINQNGGTLGDGTTANPNTTYVDFSADCSKDGTQGKPLDVKTGPGSTLTLELDGKDLIEATADNAVLLISDFVQVHGGFAFTKSADLSVTLSDGTSKNVQVTTFGIEHVNAFVGAGPYFVDSDGDGDIDDYDIPSVDAVGLLLKNVTMALALFKPTTGSGSYYAVSASADSIELPGLNLGGSDTFSLSASGYRIEANGGSDGAINFAALPGGKLTVPTGAGSVDFDYTSALQRVAIENATLIIGDYVYVSGGLSFTKQSDLNVSLSDQDHTQRPVTAYAFSAGNVDMFVGSGLYFVDSDGDGDIDEFDERDEDAIGLALENVNFGLILMRPSNPTCQSIKYLALKATANYAGLVGLDILKLSASGISVEYNSVKNPNDTNDTRVVDFKASFVNPGETPGYKLDTGNGELKIDYSSKLLRASVADAEMQIDSYVFARGALAFEKGEVLDVTLSDNMTKEVSSINVGAEGLNMFFGVNGPSWTDEEAVGLAITNADLAFALLKPTTSDDTTRYIGLKASADQLGFVGSDVFQLEASSVVVDLNLASRKGATEPLPVINFSALPGGGYSVPTGGAEETLLDFAGKRIHASADDVLINVAEFLYLNGNVALDLGSRELVTINTGIPSNLGTLASGAVTMINSALSELSAKLITLKSEVKDALTNAINTVKTTINDLVNSIVDTIVAKLQSSLEDAVKAVSDSVTTGLNSKTADLSVDGILDPLVADITKHVPEGPLRVLVDQLLNPIKNLIAKEFQDTIQEALTGAIDRIAGSVSGAIEAGLQSAETEIKDKIYEALDPQIARVQAKLDQLISKIEDGLTPLFNRLQGIANIDIGDNFATITGVEVDVTAIGVSNATAFAGLPPADGLDFSKSLADQDAIGLFVENFNMGLGLFKPVLSKQLPSFTAAKITADAAGFSDGGADILEIIAKVIEVELNIGGPLNEGTGALLGNATIDFVTSFPAEPPDGGDPGKPVGYAVQTGTTTEPIYLDFNSELIRASVGNASIKISEFVHISGSVAFEKGRVETVDVTGGLLSGLGDAANDVLDELGITIPPGLSIPATGADDTELSFMTIGASNVHAFVGLNGPYWVEDLDGDGHVSWAFNTGDGTVVSLSANDEPVTVNGLTYGDKDGDGVVDADETAELSVKAAGIVVNDFDFGMAIMTPTNPLDFARYFALRATAEQIALVGLEGVTLEATKLLVEVNQSSPSIYGLPLFPVVDFANTPQFASEQLTLFDTSDDGVITLGELAKLNSTLTTKFAALSGVSLTDLTPVDHEALLEILNTDDTGDSRGVIDIDEAAALLVGGNEEATAEAAAADIDGDGKIDPIGYEVLTGGDPVYLTMDSSLIRAQGFVELNIFDALYLTGSIAFELGPTQQVTLTDGTTKTVTTMTIGAANVTAFIGANGPYWTDANGDHSVDSDELNSNSIGFHITDLDVGIMVMASVNLSDLGVYLAAKASVESFGVVGIDFLTAAGKFDLALNVGLGISGADVVDFVASFPDNDGDGPDQVGFEVNTGDPTSPVVMDFDQFLISFQLGGIVTIYDGPQSNQSSSAVVKLNGLLLFEVDSTGLTAFVSAGLEFGPDIGASSDNKLFDMSAVGGLVINASGIAADIDLSLSVGGALSGVLSLNASARVVFNTTGVDQTITIPERYADFLGGDGSTTFTIFGGAPRLDGTFEEPGPYFLVLLEGDLTIASAFVITADFHLKISGAGLNLGFNGSIDLGGFASLAVAGGAVIENGVFAAYLDLGVDIEIARIGIKGDAVLEINSGNTSKKLGADHQVAANTFKVTVDAAIDLFGIFEATGSVKIGVENSLFSIKVDATLDFFGIAEVAISGYFDSDGSFSLSGTLNLDLTLGGFGIKGGIGVTIDNTGISGQGSVGLVVLGKDINIASAELSVNWEEVTFRIRAEGPLGVWLEVNGGVKENGTYWWSIDGGLGDFGAIFDAIGDAADAAVAEASEAVANAVQDLGEAILDFGSDAIKFCDGLITDLNGVVKDIIGKVSSLFQSSKTVVYDLSENENELTEDTDLTDFINLYYSYSASSESGVLEINNKSASKLCLAIVGDNLIVDAPDETRHVVVAQKVNCTRYFDTSGWPWNWHWSDWTEVSRTDIYKTITFSNMSSFPKTSISKIVINGSESPETIILDRDSISIPTDVYGKGGNDIIVTGKGDDYVEGGEGNDTIFTYEGDDELYGEDGDDKLMSGTGDDTLYGGSGNDLLDESYGRVSTDTDSENNNLYGGSGDDIILGSPGQDTIEGGDGNDLLMGFYQNDIYIFNDNYGKDTLVDYYGEEILDFSEATNALDIIMSVKGITASAGTGDLLSIDPYVWIEQLKIGKGDDHVTSTALPDHHIDIIDEGGNDIYHFNFQNITAQDVCRVSIQDNAGNEDNEDELIFNYTTEQEDDLVRSGGPPDGTGTVGVSGKGWVAYAGIEWLDVLPLANVAPTLVLDPVAPINENGTATLAGNILDPDNYQVTNLTIVDEMIAGSRVSTKYTGEIGQADIKDNVDGRWSYNNAVPGPGGDDYAIVGTGTLQVNTAGVFSFAISGDDGGRLRIDGHDVIVDDSLHGFDDRFGEAELTAGAHTFEWVGFERSGGAGWEFSVAVGTKSDPVDSSNGWKVVGDPNPHSEIKLDGQIDVTAYYAPPETFTLTVDWGEGSPEVFNLGPHNSFSVTHQYLDDNPTGTPSDTYTISVTVTDNAQGIGSDTETVTVNNVAPTLSNMSITPDEIYEGNSATLTGTITDPGTQDTLTLTVDWGDGNTDAYTYDAGTTSFSQPHQYLDDNPTGAASVVYRVEITVTDDDGGVGSTDPFAGLSWTTSGPGATSASSPAADLMQFTYDHTPSSYNWETWTFSATAATTGSVAFDWDYLRCHSWYQSYAKATAYADGPSGRTWVTLYDGLGGEGRNTGSATLELYEGYGFGFQTKGKHYDSSRIMKGTLSVLTGPSLSVTVKNVAPTVVLDPVAPIDENGIAALAGNILSPDLDYQVTNLTIVDEMIAGIRVSTTATGKIDQADIKDNVDGRWSYNNAMPGGGGDDYAIVGTGTLQVNTAGVFSFAISGDDGGRLRIDGNDVIVDDSLHGFDDRFGEAELTAGAHTFEWVGFERSAGAGWEFSVAVGTKSDPVPVDSSNGWKVVGGPNPHSEIKLDGQIDVTAYYAPPAAFPFELTFDWGDGNTDTYNYDAGTTSFSETHQYLDDNPTGTSSDTYTILVTVTNDKGVGSDTETVKVNNVAPALSNVSITPEIDEGDSAMLTGTITDPGTQDTFTLAIDWGDPLSPDDTQSFDLGTTVLTKAANGIDWNPTTRQLSVDHQYLDDNPTDTPSDVYRIEMTVTDDDGGVYSTDPFAGLSWTTSGPGTTSASSPAAGLMQFTYDHTPSSYNWETWTFSATAATTGSVAFDWDYLRCHSWYQSYAIAKAYADSPSGRTWVTLYDGWGGNGTDTGSAILELYEGYGFGFQTEGKHFDSSRIMQGTLSVMTGQSVSVTVNNVAPTLSNVSITPEIYKGDSATLTGTITDPGTQDMLTLIVDWGDGSTDTYTYSAGTTSFSETHQYVADNPTGTPSYVYRVEITVTDDDGGVGSTDPFAGILWTTSGPGATSASSPASGLMQFTYDNTPSSYYWETWTFSATAATTETVTFEWDYLRHHSWYQSYARAKAYADGPSGRTWVTLYDGWGGDGTDTGSAILELYEGYGFGFQTKGKHYDSSRIMQGTLSVLTGPSLSVRVNNVEPTVMLDPVAAIDENGTATLSGNILDLKRDYQVTNLTIVDEMIAGSRVSTTAMGTVNQADIKDNADGRWSYNNAVPGGGGDDYAIVGTGTLQVYTDGVFSFAISGDDGGRLRIDGHDVIVDDSLHGFEDRFGVAELTAGLHTFEWVGFERGYGAGWEFSVAVGTNSEPVDSSNGWKVVGDPDPHSEISLDGQIDVTAYYASSKTFTLTVDWGEGSPEVFDLGPHNPDFSPKV